MKIFFALLLLPALCSAAKPDFAVTRNGETVSFTGPIHDASAAALNREIEAGARLIDIDSEGGEAQAGLAIAHNMRRHGVSIQVRKYCMSTCANYLFLVARQKTVLPGAMLGFHGGPTRADAVKVKPEDHPMLQQMAGYFRESEELYKTIGFNPALIDYSGELTRLPKPVLKFAITPSGGKTRHFDDKDAAVDYMVRLKLKKIGYGATIKKQTESGTTMYFPNRRSLEACGVTGLAEYSYPASDKELAARMRSIGDGLTAIGEFSDVAGGAAICQAKAPSTSTTSS